MDFIVACSDLLSFIMWALRLLSQVFVEIAWPILTGFCMIQKKSERKTRHCKTRHCKIRYFKKGHGIQMQEKNRLTSFMI